MYHWLFPNLHHSRNHGPVVQGSRILCIYEKTGDNTMVFEVVSGMETAISTTGNTKQGEEEIPEVKTYPVSVFQRAILKKK